MTSCNLTRRVRDILISLRIRFRKKMIKLVHDGNIVPIYAGETIDISDVV